MLIVDKVELLGITVPDALQGTVITVLSVMVVTGSAGAGAIVVMVAPAAFVLLGEAEGAAVGQRVIVEGTLVMIPGFWLM